MNPRYKILYHIDGSATVVAENGEDETLLKFKDEVARAQLKHAVDLYLKRFTQRTTYGTDFDEYAHVLKLWAMLNPIRRE